MNKNILAIAIAAAVAAPSAFAAATVYGNAHMSVDSVGDGKNSVMAVGSNSSYVGIKGDEDLGSGLKAVYQMEFQLNMDGDGSAAKTTTDSNGDTTSVSEAGSTGFTSMRNTFVGIGGGFGTVLLGKHDTPLKIVGRKFDLFGDRIGDTRNLTSGDGATFGWDLRPNDVIAYVSPAVSGFTGILAYVAPEADKVATANGSNASNKDAGAWSGVVMGSIGKLDLALAHENHGSAFSGATDKSMAATRLGASYDFGMVKVNGMYANQDMTANTIGTKITDRNIYGLGAAVKVGAAGTVKAQYYVTDESASKAKDGAGMLAVGYDHALSKNTTAYVAYALTDNDKNGTFGVAGGGHGEYIKDVATNANGTSKDPSAFSVGIQHKF